MMDLKSLWRAFRGKGPWGGNLNMGENKIDNVSSLKISPTDIQRYHENMRLAHSYLPFRGTWTKYSGNPLLTTGSQAWEETDSSSFIIGAHNPSMIKVGDTYYLYWEQKHDTTTDYVIAGATSTDLKNWTKMNGNPILESSESGWDDVYVADPSVHYIDGSWYIFYDGYNDAGGYQIGLATSSDGKNWSKSGSNPILTEGTSGEWDDEMVHQPEVLWINGMWYMFYNGNDGSNWSIGLAVSNDGDATSFEKYGNNPVVSYNEFSGITTKRCNRTIVWDGTLYMPISTAANGKKLLSSPDNGYNWNLLGDLTIAKGSAGSWDSDYTGIKLLWVEGTRLYIIYLGRDSDNTNIRNLGLAWRDFE